MGRLRRTGTQRQFPASEVRFPPPDGDSSMRLKHNSTAPNIVPSKLRAQQCPKDSAKMDGTASPDRDPKTVPSSEVRFPPPDGDSSTRLKYNSTAPKIVPSKLRAQQCPKDSAKMGGTASPDRAPKKRGAFLPPEGDSSFHAMVMVPYVPKQFRWLQR